MKLGPFPPIHIPMLSSKNQSTKRTTNGSLLSACWQGNLPLVRYLVLYHGHSLQQRDRHSGLMPLLLAAQHGHLELLQFITSTIMENDTVDLLYDVDPFCQTTVLHRAASNGQFHIVQFWMEHARERHGNGSSTSDIYPTVGMLQLEQTDSKGTTPFMMACQKGHKDIAHYLAMHHSANIQLVNNHGMTALTMALRHSHWEIAQWLLTTMGASIHTSPSPMQIICENNSTQKHTIHANNDVDDDDQPQQQSPLHAVIMIPLLLHLGADINERFSDGQTLLWIASHAGNAPVVEYLLNELQVDMQPTLEYMGCDMMQMPRCGGNSTHASSSMDHPLPQGIFSSSSSNNNEQYTAMIWEDYPAFPPNVRKVWKQRAEFLQQRWTFIHDFLGGSLGWFHNDRYRKHEE